LFNNILLPVNLGAQSEVTVERAVLFANKLDCNLHILYTSRPFLFSDSAFPSGRMKAEKKKKLFEIQADYSAKMKKGLLLYSVFRNGDPESEVASYAQAHSIDLVYIGDEKEHISLFRKKFNINRLAKQANCAVFALNTQPELRSFEKIVLPIDQSLPINRMRVAIYFAQQFNAVIHLVSQGGTPLSEENRVYLEKAYQLLKNNTELPLVCSTCSGDGKEESVIDYANSINAGMIVVKPSAMFRARGFLRGIFSSTVFKSPRVPIMMVE
jgi:nucleotide-binding universal stress UspA family protein